MQAFRLQALYAGVLAAGLSGGALAGTVTSDGPDIVIKTDSGFSAQTVDGAFKFDIGGRIMWDYDYADGIYDQSDADGDGRPDNDDANGFEMRRARIELKGTSYKHWHYTLKINMSDGSDAENGGANTVDTAVIKYTGLGWAYVKVGRDKVPFNLEELTSSKYISTVERGFYQDFLAGGGFGKQQHLAFGGNLAEQFTWHVAPFIDQEVQDTDATKQVGHGARVTWSPVHDSGNVLHFGLAYFDAGAEATAAATEDTVFRTRFGVHNVDDFDDGNTAGANDFRPRIRADLDDDVTYGLEAAWVAGPFSVQGEYFNRDMDVANSTLSPEIDAWYLQGTYTLTGESRGYKWKDGKFDKIKPKGKYGAWEAVVKYEDVEVDLDTAAMRELEADLLTLGLNWYATSNVALKLNYLMLDTDGFDTVNLGGLPAAYTANSFPQALSDEDGDAVTARIQYIF